MFLKLQKPKSRPFQDSKVISGIGLLYPRSSSSDRLPSFNESRRTSIRNNSSILKNSQSGFASEISGSLAGSRLIKRRSDAFQTGTGGERVYANQQSSPRKQLPQKPMSIQEKIQSLFEKYSDKTYIISLISYYQRKWDQDSERFLKEQKYNSLIALIMERTTQFNPLLEDFVTHEYDSYTESERKLLLSIVYKQYLKLINTLESASKQVLGRIPDERTIRQQSDLFELFRTLIRMYDIKNIYSQEKMRETWVLFSETYSLRKSQMMANVSQKMRGMMDVLLEVEKYFTAFQRQVIRLQNINKGLERQLEKAKELLQHKVLYTPIEVDYSKIKQIRDNQKKEIFDDLDSNIVKYYKSRIKELQSTIAIYQQKTVELEATIRKKDEQISDLKVQVNRLANEKPLMIDAETQLFLVASKKSIESIEQHGNNSNPYDAFLQNVNTPFQFSKISTSNIINLFLVDKVLYDYELIKHKAQLKPLRLFLYEWFLIKTGSKKVAQIFCKNFALSLAELRRTNKRYHLFSKMTGLLKPKKKNLMDDLDLIFHQTQLVWYYYVRIALVYRKKLNENPSGYPIVPPTSIEDITRLSLRKTYEIIEEFFEGQGLEKPEGLHTKVDMYSINEISKFKMSDEQFRKEQLQQIHILRDITFDIICGFLVEYVSNLKCTIVEKFLRAVHVRQRQKKAPITYVEFEGIFKRFYREKRSKMELVFARLCLTNQSNMLDIENVRPVVELLVQDQTKIRTIFDKIDSLKLLVYSEKAAVKWMEKRTSHPNAFENFKERYYLDFFDFYDSTSFLSDVYHNVKHLIRKCIYNESGRDKDMQIDEEPAEQIIEEKVISKEQEAKQQRDEEEEDKQPEEEAKQATDKDISLLQRKVEEFKTIFTKVPKFSKRIITMDQMLVHNVRRKDCIDATEYTWRVLREILMILADKSDLM